MLSCQKYLDYVLSVVYFLLWWPSWATSCPAKYLIKNFHHGSADRSWGEGKLPANIIQCSSIWWSLYCIVAVFIHKILCWAREKWQPKKVLFKKNTFLSFSIAFFHIPLFFFPPQNNSLVFWSVLSELSESPFDLLYGGHLTQLGPPSFTCPLVCQLWEAWAKTLNGGNLLWFMFFSFPHLTQQYDYDSDSIA